MEHANQDAIATRLDIDKGAVAKTLASLEKKQYVIRQENPDNRREKLVTVTPAGEAMNQRMVEMLKAWDDSLLIGLTSEEITQFEAISQKISINAKSFLKENVKK
jgi:DNA-binding MarR family transcriptional regulator